MIPIELRRKVASGEIKAWDVCTARVGVCEEDIRLTQEGLKDSWGYPLIFCPCPKFTIQGHAPGPRGSNAHELGEGSDGPGADIRHEMRGKKPAKTVSGPAPIIDNKEGREKK